MKVGELKVLLNDQLHKHREKLVCDANTIVNMHDLQVAKRTNLSYNEHVEVQDS